MTERVLGQGTFADVCWHAGRWWCVWQNGEALQIVSVESDSLRDVSFTAITLGPDAGAFPRLLSWADRLWLAYRDGQPGAYHVRLRELNGTASFDLGVGHGNDLVALGAGDVAWQSTGAPTYGVMRRPLVGTEPARQVRNGAPTGLSRVLPDRVTLVDEDRLALDGYTRPCWAGDLVVAEHPQGGTYARLQDGRELRLWNGDDAFTPRCATDGADRFAVVTWGGPGVRIVQVSRAEFHAAVPTPEPVLDTSGQIIDLWNYILPNAKKWPRTSRRSDSHGHPMDCKYDGRNLWFLPFDQSKSVGQHDHWVRFIREGDMPDTETLTLREDRSNDGQSTGNYSFTHGLWCRRLMKPGDFVENPHNCEVRYIGHGSCGILRVNRLPFRVTFDRHWLLFDRGPLGWGPCVRLKYDPGTADDSYELEYFADDGGSSFRFEVYNQKTGELRHWTEFDVIDRTQPSLPPTVGCWRREHLALTTDNWPPKPPTEEHMNENDIRLVSTPVPPDIFLGALMRFRNEVLLDRDKVGDDSMGAGALMYFVPNYNAAVVGELARHGLPTGSPQQIFEKWAGMSGVGLQRAADIYNREQKGEGGNGGGGGGGGAQAVDPIQGQLRIESSAFVDDNGPVLPIFCHFGDALSRWSRGHQANVAAILDDIASAGYQGIRFWSTLGLDDHGGGFWAGRQVGPAYTDQYWAHVEAFLMAVRDRGLRVQLSQGDVRGVAIPDRRAFAYQMADIVNRVGPNVIAIFEGANESRDTGEPDAGRLAQFVSQFHERCAQPLCALSAFTGTEDVGILNDFSRAPADLFICHSYRGGRWWDKVRHIFSLQYEGKPEKRIGWNGEGPGCGQLVSAISGREEIDADVYRALAAQALLTRQGYVWFSGPGVISDHDNGERLQNMPGFWDVPKVRALLPVDVMRFPEIWHGGDGRPWSPRRAFRAIGEMRCDHVVNGNRFVCLIYGPESLDVPQNRPLSIQQDVRFGNKARLVVGEFA